MRQTIKDVTCYPDPITGRMCVSMQVATKPDDGPAVQFTLRVDERGVWMTPHTDDGATTSVGALPFHDLFVACLNAKYRYAAPTDPKEGESNG